jgi:hypothetical protein
LYFTGEISYIFGKIKTAAVKELQPFYIVSGIFGALGFFGVFGG